jgi:hypothetical protein
MHTTVTPRVIHPLLIDSRTVDFRRDAIISTGHMSAADNLALHAATSAGVFPDGYYARTADGWIFRTPWHPDDQPAVEAWQDLGLSNELAENIRTIAHAGFCRVEFDADAPRVPGLHWFDW